MTVLALAPPALALVGGAEGRASTTAPAKPNPGPTGMDSSASFPPGDFYSSAIAVTFSKVKIYMFILTGVSWPNSDWKKEKKNRTQID